MNRDEAPTRFKAVRTKDRKSYIKSGNCPALFKMDHDFIQLFSLGLGDRKDEYEIVTVELRVIENEPR